MGYSNLTRKGSLLDRGVTPFYDLKTVEEYKKTLDPATLEGTTFKYYKGLGTSTREEGQEYFRDIDNHRSAFKWTEGKHTVDKLSCV